MATNTSTFFAGMGTTFVILALGFGGGLMLAKTVMEPRSEQQARAPSEPPVRVILPASAEPAQPPQLSPTTTTETAPPQPVQPPVKEAVLPVKTVEQVDTRKAEAEEREHRKRSAERKTKRLAAERAKRQQQLEQGQGAPVMAFGGNESRQSGGFGFFGN
jgi:outer membrane biosynthesis protein TonB